MLTLARQEATRYEWITSLCAEPFDVVDFVDLRFRQLSLFNAPLESAMKRTENKNEDRNVQQESKGTTRYSICVAVDLSMNRIKSMDSKSSPLWADGLMYLNISSNLLTSLNGIGVCSNLRRLDANHNFIESFGDGSTCISVCKHLLELRLADNKLIKLTPKESMSSLLYLEVSMNEIHDLVDIHNAFPNLCTFVCSNNFVNDLRPLEYMRLKHLDLSGNNLENLQEIKFTLSTLRNTLRSINLCDTRVSKDEYYIFHLLDSCREINTIDNRELGSNLVNMLQLMSLEKQWGNISRRLREFYASKLGEIYVQHEQRKRQSSERNDRIDLDLDDQIQSLNSAARGIINYVIEQRI